MDKVFVFAAGTLTGAMLIGIPLYASQMAFLIVPAAACLAAAAVDYWVQVSGRERRSQGKETSGQSRCIL